MDILTLNRYSSWYSDSGHLDVIKYQIYKEFVAFTKIYKKPMLFTEYGAGSLSGLHSVRHKNGRSYLIVFVKKEIQIF
jgi:beta-glucuronidase